MLHHTHITEQEKLKEKYFSLCSSWKQFSYKQAVVNWHFCKDCKSFAIFISLVCVEDVEEKKNCEDEHEKKRNRYEQRWAK